MENLLSNKNEIIERIDDMLDNISKELFELNDEHYWAIISEIEWYSHLRDVEKNPNDTVKEFLIGFLDVDMISNIKNFVVEKRKEIQHSFMQYYKNKKKKKNEAYYSNDTLWDVSASIVGMGKSAYELAINSPEFVEFIAKTKNYYENFEYGFDAAIYETNELIRKWESNLNNEYENENE